MEIKLKKPIQAHGEEVDTITLREPNGEDIRIVNELPYSLVESGEVRLNMAAISKYTVRLAGIPRSSVDQMTASDMNTIAWKVAGFFLGSEEA